MASRWRSRAGYWRRAIKFAWEGRRLFYSRMTRRELLWVPLAASLRAVPARGEPASRTIRLRASDVDAQPLRDACVNGVIVPVNLLRACKAIGVPVIYSNPLM